MDPRATLQLLATMPMRFSGLVVENTNRCNARCEICYQSAGPKGSDILGRGRLPRDVIERCIREAIEIPTLTPRFHLAGGESFMDLEECYALFSAACAAGYLDITCTTNAFWARKMDKARVVTENARRAGLTSMEISWDYWHQPYIPATAVANALIACKAADIETNLRVLTTKTHGLDEALAALPEDALNAAHRITSGPVFATGRAALTTPLDDLHASPSGSSGSCHAVLNLTVNSFGNVFPCCAGFDQTKNYTFGNIHTESIVDIADRINADPIARTVVFRGVEALLPVLRRAGVDIGEEFKNMCQLCWNIFSSERCVEVLKNHVAAVRERAFQRLVSAL